MRFGASFRRADHRDVGPAQPVINRDIEVRTGTRRGLFDLTSSCAEFVAGQGDGLLTVFVPHATAGVVIMELGAGSDEDLMVALDRQAMAPTTSCRCSWRRR